MLGYFINEVPHPVFKSKSVVKEGFYLGHLKAGEVIGIGFPYIHNVYKLSEFGDLMFRYHWDYCKLCQHLVD